MTETEPLYKRNPEFIYRRVSDELILVPIHKNMADMEAIFSLNEVGAFIWDKLEFPLSLEQIEKTLVGEFDAELRIIQSDIKQFLAEMVALGAVVRS